MQYIEEGMCYGKIALHIQSPKKKKIYKIKNVCTFPIPKLLQSINPLN